MRNIAIKKFSVITALMLALFIGVVNGQSDLAPVSNNEIIVKLNQAGDINAILSQYGLSLPPHGQMGNRPIFRLRAPQGVPLDQLITLLQADPLQRVTLGEPKYAVGSPNASSGPW